MNAESIRPFVLSLFSIVGMGGVLWVVYWLLMKRNPSIGKERMFPRQVIMIGVVLLSIVVVVLLLPMSVKSRGQVLGLIGIIISGILAFSSTTITANLMAGFLLRVTKPFRVGDFISVREYFGRVVERGLFDTEIQSENRELISIPNTFLITNPVSTVRSSGTVVSATLSLGYDLHHSKVESLLLRAAEESGLEERFVHILELGNYSVTYRVAGFLSDVKGLITSRSNLYRTVLDVLHSENVEIMSPSFMNQRRLAEGRKIIPTPIKGEQSGGAAIAERIVFDKAEQAERIEEEKRLLKANIKDLEKRREEAPENEKKSMEEAITRMRDQLKLLEEEIGEPD